MLDMPDRIALAGSTFAGCMALSVSSSQFAPCYMSVPPNSEPSLSLPLLLHLPKNEKSIGRKILTFRDQDELSPA